MLSTIKLRFVVVLAALLCLTVFGNAQDHVPRQGTLFLTTAGEIGQIVSISDASGQLQSVFTNLRHPGGLQCSNENRLFVSALEGDHVQRVELLRIEPIEGQIESLLAQSSDDWDIGNMSQYAFSPNGDLYLGTWSAESGEKTSGVWKVSNANSISELPLLPEQILGGDQFSFPFDDKDEDAHDEFASVDVVGFLNAGQFRDDMIVIDSPTFFAVADTQENRGASSTIFRVKAPDYMEAEKFIEAADVPSDYYVFSPTDIVQASNGNILVTDFGNDRILEFSSDGTYQSIFAELDSPTDMDIGPDGLIYVTNAVTINGEGRNGRLLVYQTDGELVDSFMYSTRLAGVAICPAPMDVMAIDVIDEQIPDRDNDGVPDRDDWCPDFAGTINKNGC